MIWKVCGMKDPENIRQAALLRPDLMGFIFYDRSLRFAGQLDPHLVQIPQRIRKVGVFVNEKIEAVCERVETWGLEMVQLHGDESPDYIDALRQSVDVEIIKAIRVMDALPADQMQPYVGKVAGFLFDTAINGTHGGTGRKFDWKILRSYPFETPFLLSGGIDIDDLVEIKKMNHSAMWGIDVNSKFEIEPGMKDIEKLKSLKEQL
ncbi:MAG: phosphoribosylanthranilate isomerase [Cyclobacteriaceae bacterium]|nr:phosphoribosylanthranilate isomerase [Cyclobacteriaceae bacterium]